MKSQKIKTIIIYNVLLALLQRRRCAYYLNGVSHHFFFNVRARSFDAQTFNLLQYVHKREYANVHFHVIKTKFVDLIHLVSAV